MALIQIFTFLAITCAARAEHVHDQHGQPIGYSYAKFSGPVSGPSQEIHTHDEHGKYVDFVSKPDYQFEYGVEDPKTQVSQFRKENRQDDAVVGEYTYTDPFGHVRTVKYTADKLHGFRAEIYVNGKLETPHSSSHHHDVQSAVHAEASQPLMHVHHEEPAHHLHQDEPTQYDESRDYSGSNEDY